MALKLLYLAQLLLLVPVLHLSASNLMIETNPGAKVIVNNNSIFSLDKSESTVTLSSDLFDSAKNTVRLQIEAKGYKPLAVTLSANMIDGSQPLMLNLTPLPFWTQWGSQLIYLSLVFFLFIAGYLINKRRQKPDPVYADQSDPKPDPAPEATLKKFDQYLLEKHIASGGISKVYKAINSEEKTVALKVMSNFLNDRDMIGKFIGEGQALKNINVRFPLAPVVEVFDFGRENQEPDGTPYIAMELVDGLSLSEKIKDGLLSDADKIEIIKQLTSALHATHSVDVIHRDISPDNVLIRNEDQIKICLIDFGVAKHEVNWLKGTSYGAAYGKPEYMSPEQLSGDVNINYRSDYYSLGVLAFTLFCGNAPFQDPNNYKVGDMHKNNPVPEMPPRVPDNIQKLIRKLMAKEPAQRPKSPTEILSFLNSN